MITVYGRGQSRSFRALWALNEAGVALDYVEVNETIKASSEYLRLNPQGKVPTLVHGELVLTESAAMVNYAGALAPRSLIPTGANERARFDEICYFIMADFEQPLWTIGKHRFALPEAQRQESVIETAVWEFEKSQRALLSHVGKRPFAVGEQFTLADVLLAHTLNWAIRFEMTVAPSLQAYRDTHYARPACQKSLALVQ